MAHPLCVSCEAKGEVRPAEELDHILPVSKGGTNDGSNLQGLCADCHDAKTRMDFGWKEKVITGEDGWPKEDEARGGKKV